jgi:hypothetical protein
MRQQNRKRHKAQSATEVLLREVQAYQVQNSCNYIEALRNVTREKPELWEKHKEGLQTIKPNRREQVVLKAKARSYLLRVVTLIDSWGSRDHTFAIAHQSSTVERAVQRGVIVPDEAPNRLHRVMTSLATVAYRILKTMAANEPVSNDDLDMLTAVLNQHQDPIRFQPVAPTDARLSYRRKGGLDVSLVDDLLHYMDIAAKYGREHHRCQRKECGRLMISGRGGKKFCSNYCRNKFWSYSEQKPYYIRQKELSDKRQTKSEPRKKTSRNRAS